MRWYRTLFWKQHETAFCPDRINSYSSRKRVTYSILLISLSHHYWREPLIILPSTRNRNVSSARLSGGTDCLILSHACKGHNGQFPEQDERTSLHRISDYSFKDYSVLHTSVTYYNGKFEVSFVSWIALILCSSLTIIVPLLENSCLWTI